MSDFLAAMASTANNREHRPILVVCDQVRGPFRGIPCTGQGAHADCRVAYWQRVDAEAAAEAEQQRVSLGALRPKRRIRA